MKKSEEEGQASRGWRIHRKMGSSVGSHVAENCRQGCHVGSGTFIDWDAAAIFQSCLEKGRVGCTEPAEEWGQDEALAAHEEYSSKKFAREGRGSDTDLVGWRRGLSAHLQTGMGPRKQRAEALKGRNTKGGARSGLEDRHRTGHRLTGGRFFFFSQTEVKEK